MDSCSGFWTKANCFIALVLAHPPTTAAQGYDIQGNQVVVDSRAHWENWQVPTHLVRIEPSGTVRANNFRQIYNLLDDRSFARAIPIDKDKPRIANIDSALRLNINGELATNSQGNPVFDYFLRPGVSRVGSNPELAANILDDDPTTFWEPNPDDPIDQWWIELDLARAVPVERLRLRFVDEELGDPFLRFILLFEQKQLPFVEDAAKFDFGTFIPFKGINRDRRVITIDAEQTSSLLPPAGEGLIEERLVQSQADAQWTGKITETIRIQITETRGERAELISEEQWNALLPNQRGAVAYFVRDVVGREEPVDSTTYGGLDPERRGRRDFFRRELPRLAEVDAWGWGDNAALGMLEGGGSINNTLGLGSPENVYDGELSSYYKHIYFNEVTPTKFLVNTDLGGTVWLDQVRIISQGNRYNQAPTVRGYILRASSGVRDAEGRIKYQQISNPIHEKNAENGLPQHLTDIVAPPRRVRFFQFLTLKNIPQGSTTSGVLSPGLGEFMLFSEGPPAEAILESDVVEFPRPVDLGAVYWDADTPPGTRVEIRTRTGDQLRRRIRFFDSGGGEKKDFAAWNKLLSFLKGPIDTTFVPGAGWSQWSQPYEFPGERVSSPALRRFMQIQARLIADNRSAPPALERISVEFHEPTVRELAAELWPSQVPAGLSDTFTVFIRPLLVEEPIAEASPGFDELLLSSRPALDMELIDVAVGTEAEFGQDEPFRRYDRRLDNRLESADGTAVEILQDRGDSLQLRFAQVVQPAPAELAPRSYFRSLEEGDEVPTRTDGTILDASTYGSLPEEQKGSVRYFSLEGGEATLEEVDRDIWESLAAEVRGPVRYFRIVGGLGDQSPFDAMGDSLTAGDYAQLPAGEQGQILGAGRLIRLRFTGAVFLHGTELNVAARRSGSDVPWQLGEAGDVTELTPGRDMVVSVLGSRGVVRDLTVTPNPFTPNGDGINDAATIGLSLFRVFEPRPLTLKVFTLDGRPVRRLEQMAAGGRREFEWDGRDRHGKIVPPGLYLVKVEAEADDSSVAGQTDVRVIGVVY